MEFKQFKSDMEEKNNATLRKLINEYKASGINPLEAAIEDIIGRLREMGERPDKNLVRLLHLAQSRSNRGAAYTAAVKEAYKPAPRKRSGSKSPRTRKAHSLLKKAMRARYTRKRGKTVHPPIQTPSTFITGITVAPGSRKRWAAEKAPKKGNTVYISTSRGAPLLRTPVVVWSAARDEPLTPGFLRELTKHLKEDP